MRLFAKNLLFTVIVPGAVTVLLPRTILEHWPAPEAAVPSAMRAGGLGAVLAGASLYASALATFALAGRGTPAPVDPPRCLVVSGPYRWMRNPMYVGVILLLAGEALYFAAPPLAVYAVGCFAAFHSFVVLYEEPHLRRRFGAAYVAYGASVPRWVPRHDATPVPPAEPG
jgi:protein-S-isoprenylcysteine O-methyltransferase Ste14